MKIIYFVCVLQQISRESFTVENDGNDKNDNKYEYNGTLRVFFQDMGDKGHELLYGDNRETRPMKGETPTERKGPSLACSKVHPTNNRTNDGSLKDFRK